MLGLLDAVSSDCHCSFHLIKMPSSTFNSCGYLLLFTLALFFIRTSTFAVEAETKVDFLFFLSFEPEMFLSMFSFLGEFTSLLFNG